MLLTRESSGASRIGSTISAMPIFKVMCLTGGVKMVVKEGLGPSPFDRVPVGLDPCGRGVRRGAHCVLLRSSSAPEAGERA